MKVRLGHRACVLLLFDLKIGQHYQRVNVWAAPDAGLIAAHCRRAQRVNPVSQLASQTGTRHQQAVTRVCAELSQCCCLHWLISVLVVVMVVVAGFGWWRVLLRNRTPLSFIDSAKAKRKRVRSHLCRAEWKMERVRLRYVRLIILCVHARQCVCGPKFIFVRTCMCRVPIFCMEKYIDTRQRKPEIIIMSWWGVVFFFYRFSNKNRNVIIFVSRALYHWQTQTHTYTPNNQHPPPTIKYNIQTRGVDDKPLWRRRNNAIILYHYIGIMISTRCDTSAGGQRSHCQNIPATLATRCVVIKSIVSRFM